MSESPPSHPKHVWLQRFGARLMQLQPDLNAVAATKRAIDTFHDAAGLEPEAAADNLVADERRGDDEATDGERPVCESKELDAGARVEVSAAPLPVFKASGLIRLAG